MALSSSNPCAVSYRLISCVSNMPRGGRHGWLLLGQPGPVVRGQPAYGRGDGVRVAVRDPATTWRLPRAVRSSGWQQRSVGAPKWRVRVFAHQHTRLARQRPSSNTRRHSHYKSCFHHVTAGVIRRLSTPSCVRLRRPNSTIRPFRDISSSSSLPPRGVVRARIRAAAASRLTVHEEVAAAQPTAEERAAVVAESIWYTLPDSRDLCRAFFALPGSVFRLHMRAADAERERPARGPRKTDQAPRAVLWSAHCVRCHRDALLESRGAGVGAYSSKHLTASHEHPCYNRVERRSFGALLVPYSRRCLQTFLPAAYCAPGSRQELVVPSNNST